MNRREALSSVALLLGGTLIGMEAFLSGCGTGDKKAAVTSMEFSPDDIAFLDEVGETILPATATPGAKAAKIGDFMKTIVNDCYEEKEQHVFHEGITKLNDASKAKYSKGFMDLSPADKHDLLVAMDKDSKDSKKKMDEYFNAMTEEQKHELTLQQNKDGKDPRADKRREDPLLYFRMMKELTLWGYFTSEVGATQALRYVAVPGRYEGCVPYKKGDRAWAT